MSDPQQALKVLIVCLGNICRSPMGEAVLRDVAAKRGIEITVDSCGTSGYHVGEEPDGRTIAVCVENNVSISHRARRISTQDFTTFSYILAADENNLHNLDCIKPQNATAKIRLWGSYLDEKPIADPYYGKKEDFRKVYQQCVALSNAFLDHITGDTST
ncbi:hypothetical protein APHAL10511_006110 [Amanita phalloides]|nr:hypothetical protein APHAL10511_006110 [Amanita phalloides]